jgi:hypothetical protein
MDSSIDTLQPIPIPILYLRYICQACHANIGFHDIDGQDNDNDDDENTDQDYNDDD